MLRIHDRRFLRALPKKLGVEHLHVRQVGGRSHIVGMAQAIAAFPASDEFLLGQASDRFGPAAEIVPELLYGPRPGDTQCHSDNGNVAGIVGCVGTVGGH